MRRLKILTLIKLKIMIIINEIIAKTALYNIVESIDVVVIKPNTVCVIYVNDIK